jgi:hypothetical protein
LAQRVDPERTISLDPEVISRIFALVGNEFVFDLLTLIEVLRPARSTAEI